MPKSDLETLKSAIKRSWPYDPDTKARRYIGKFFNQSRLGQKITAQVEGNHGTYTVSIQVDDDLVTSACSCYIGSSGGCHHCAALAATFLAEPDQFKEITLKPLAKVSDLIELQTYLKSVTLDTLLGDLKASGISQKAFAESIGMSTTHLSAVKSSELKNRYFHELGATKLACLWVLEHIAETKAK